MSNQKPNATAEQTDQQQHRGALPHAPETNNGMGVMQDIKFNKYNVTNKRTKAKARIWYSLDNRTDGRKCVTLYANDYGHALREVIPDRYENRTDTMTDYFDQGRAVLFETHPLYAAARLAAETFNRS